MPTPTDKELYDKVKKSVMNKIKINSAYRSGLIVKQYKEEYYKKHNNQNAYKGNKDISNLGRWFKEKWTNQDGEIGYTKKGDVYRPTIRINNKTPITFNELTKNQIKKAQEEKKKKGRVKKFKNL